MPRESVDFSMSAPEDTQERETSLLNDGSQAELTHRLKESHPAWICQTTLDLQTCRSKKRLLLQVSPVWTDLWGAYCGD